jgi:hypothetical protein
MSRMDRMGMGFDSTPNSMPMALGFLGDGMGFNL